MINWECKFWRVDFLSDRSKHRRSYFRISEMIWAVWREIYRQGLCLSFNQWLLRVISVNRCLIFKVHHALWVPPVRAALQVSFAIISNHPPFVNTFFNLFSFLLPFPPTYPRVASLLFLLFPIFLFLCGRGLIFIYYMLFTSPFSPLEHYILFDFLIDFLFPCY